MWRSHPSEWTWWHHCYWAADSWASGDVGNILGPPCQAKPLREAGGRQVHGAAEVPGEAAAVTVRACGDLVRSSGELTKVAVSQNMSLPE